MTTTISERSKPALDGERRFLIRGVGWEGYQSLLRMIGDQCIRLTYDRGDVELMSPLFKHERKKCFFGQVVRILAEELNIRVMPAGSTTLRREELDRGLEPDEGFYLGDLERIRDLDQIDLDVDPPPDLAIEIEITRSALDRVGVYSALGVPELWRFNGQTLRVLIRQEDGSYRESPTSAAFPDVAMDEVARFATMEGIRDEIEWARRFRMWVREDVLPRIGGRGGA
jgi:Uma2 family endonuclease